MTLTRLTFIFPCLIFLSILFMFSCAKNKANVIEEESGMFGQKIEIRTLPTKAKIVINEHEIGTSPLTYEIKHSDSRMLNIKAIPLYPNQYTQNIFLNCPPVPQRMTIYMNHLPEVYDKEQDKPFVPPAKIIPEPIVVTKVDTVYISKTTKEPYPITIPVIYFDTDKYDIRPSEEEKLQNLITALKHIQDLKVDIYGFADKRNTDAYNITLSLNRANSVKDYLIKNGINANRIQTYGHGIARAVDEKGVEMDLQENRKVVFVLRK